VNVYFTGDYVSDGYGNSRVHKYSPDGKLIMSWGEPGTGEGEFNIVHNSCCDADGWVYVADRENHRVQVFDGAGRYETQWQNLHRPCGLCMPYGHKPIFYVGEVGPAAAVSRDIPNLGPRVSIVDHQGKLIGRFGETRRAPSSANSSPRTGLPWTRTATSMSVRSHGLAGPRCSPTHRARRISAACRNSSESPDADPPADRCDAPAHHLAACRVG
jgi:hypothetical protein